MLFDHDGLFHDLPVETQPAQPNPAYFRYQVEEFIRILGLLPLAVGRKEYINGVLGVFHLRNLLVDLMIAEAAPQHRGGALHLNRLITPAQRETLTKMPPPVAQKEAMITGHMAYARVYLPLARRMALAWGVDWPDRFEAVTWANLNATLGLEPPHEAG
ncbi:hypothetical protein [Sulfitobacter aestuariivivens]|uniref:hypothetical protein n=1 Tax=Sulfitobacter aestuariivivens TaxID=2766981 RepID=UPI00361DD66A